MNIITRLKDKFLIGVADAVSLVASTIGPAGAGVMEVGGGNLRRHFRDGFRVLELYQNEDPEIREAVLRIRDVASNVAREAGDGTSTCTLLLGGSYETIESGMTEKHSRASIVNAIEQMKVVTLEVLAEKVLPAVEANGQPNMDVLESVATISAAGNEELGKQLAELVADVGVNGDIRIEQSYSGKVETELVSGYICDATCLDSGVFNTRRGVELGQCNVVCISDTVSDFGTLSPIIQVWQRESRLPLVFVVVDIEGTAMATLLNPRDDKGTRAPLYLVKVHTLDALEDVSKVTGAPLFSKTKGRLIRDVKSESLGTALSMRFDLKQCSIVVDPANAHNIETFGEYLTDLVENAPHEEKAKVAARVGNLNGKVGVIRVPATTQTQGFFLHEVIDDCWRATMSALRDGVAPGGGITLWAAADEVSRLFRDIDDRDLQLALIGVEYALRSVAANVCENAGLNTADCLPKFYGSFQTYRIYPGHYDKVLGAWIGPHVAQGHCLELGVLDSQAALRSAVTNAFDELKLWVNTDFIIVHNPKK